MKKIRAKYVSDDMVMNPVRICMCIDEGAFISEMDALNVPYYDRPRFVAEGKHGNVHYFQNKDDGSEIAIVCITNCESQTGIELAGLLCHEAVHIFRRAKELMGERESSSEFEAYSIQWIFQQLCWTYKTLAGL